MKKIVILILILHSLNINAQSCQASFTYGSFPSNPPSPIYFSSSATNATSSLWDFGDGSTSSLQNPNHSYTLPGVYNACLTITDSSNCSDTFCDSIWVTTCKTDFGYMPIQPNTIKFFDMPSNMPNYPTNWLWDFGDSSTSSLRFPIHTYNSSGIYHVCLNVSSLIENCIYALCKDVVVASPQNLKYSVCDGHWNDANVWNTGSVPTTNDTVLILNNVVLDSSIIINAPALLYIHEQGSLCGHTTITSRAIIYGTLNIDWISLSSGLSYTDFIPLNATQGLVVNGTWFTQYFYTNNDFTCLDYPSCNVNFEEYALKNIKIYPNPSTSTFTIQLPTQQSFTVSVIDITGRKVYENKNASGTIIIDANEFSSGVYFVKAVNERTVLRGKMIKE